MGTWSMSGSYDQLNRLTSASATAGSYSGLQMSWGYDAFGNRTSESLSGTAQMPVPTSSTIAYNASNQVSSTSLGSVGYDAAGNVTQDNQNQYLYDGDGRVCAVKNLLFGTMTGYVYGADGTRVSTGTITTWGSCDPTINGYQAQKDSISGPAGQLTETGLDSNGNVAWAHTNVWANGALIATYDPNGLHFYLNDWTGSRRVQTDYQGVIEQTCTNLPYGNGETCTPTPSEELYAGLERDSAAGLDNAVYRSYTSAFGRWTTPDPYDGSYDWSNPQSLNRYAYVNGRPMRFTDPSGQMPIPCPSGLPSSGVDPVTGLSVLMAYACDDGFSAITPGAIGAIGASGWLADVAAIAGPIGELAAIGYDIYSMFSGGKPQFKGNVKASQNGKNVPNTPNNGAGQTPVHGPWTYGKWCGPGGSGIPTDPTDAACMAHDLNYDQGGYTAGSNFQGYNAQLQNYNQLLCNAVRARRNSLTESLGHSWLPSVPPDNVINEIKADQDIDLYFTWVIAPWGNACH
jgi:RHS repeat-associated protein